MIAAIALAGATAVSAVGGASEPRLDRIAELRAQVRKEKDEVPRVVFAAIAAEGGEDAVEALDDCLDWLATPAAVEAACAALATLAANSALERDAVARLAKAAEEGVHPKSLAATNALVGIGDIAGAALRAVLEESQVAECRSAALAGVMPLLRIEGSDEALELILDNWRVPDSGSYEVAVRTVAGFRDETHLRILGEALERTTERGADFGNARAMRSLVLDALTRMPAETSDDVLRDALDSRDPDLQVAAIQALEERGAAAHRRELDRLSRDGEPKVRAEAMIALSRHVIDDVRWRRRVVLMSQHKDPHLRAAAATVLGRSRHDDARERLGELFEDEDWPVRSAAYDATLDARDPRFVPRLIARLDVERRDRADHVRDTLVGLTAQDHGTSSRRWTAWWEAEGQHAPLPTRGQVQAYLDARPPRDDGPGRSTVQFFGIPVTSDRVAFVIDSSGSMLAATGTDGRSRIDVAKRKLIEVLERLVPEARFNIVWFATGIDVWRGRLQKRTPRNLRRARSFVDDRDAEGGTALYDGLIAAWRTRDVDTIYLLTDGQPSAGRLVEPGAILADVRSRYESKPVTVHCIAVGTPSPLLESIAEITGGVYRTTN